MMVVSNIVDEPNIPNEIPDEHIPELIPVQEEIIKDGKTTERISQKQRLAMVEKALSDVKSMRSYSTASTIAPEVIKGRLKKSLHSKQKKLERKHCVAKGEASAATRAKRENLDTIRESKGIWGWDE